MGRKTSSQWEFGDLFERSPVSGGAGEEKPAAEDVSDGRRILTVTQLTASVRRRLEEGFHRIWVTGEVTNLRRQASGHIYFSLKDEGAQLSCVLFRGERGVDRDLLEDGRKVLLCGDVTVYEPRGQYQLRVQAVELQGVGALQAAFERLKARLNEEGLFAQERKRPLPVYPRRMGLVTSLTGAAIRDVVHVIERRQPGLEVVVAPCRVQGNGAAEEIAAAIRALNEWSASGDTVDRALDLILVTRGGGSLEDLWAFNEEVVARAIHSSAVPIVSAVGHEIDFTISDFVADVRAATPSAAAELITEGVFSSRQFVAEARVRLWRVARRRVEECREALRHATARLGRAHPKRVLEGRLQLLDELQGVLIRAGRRGLREETTALEHLTGRLGRLRPGLWIGRQQEVVGDLDRRLSQAAGRLLPQFRKRLEAIAAVLKLLGPANTLERGYSITTEAGSGRIIRRSGALKPGARVRTRFHQGASVSIVESVEE